MCTVSNVSGGYFRQYPNPLDFPPAIWPDYQEAIRKARLYDQMTGQPDCQDLEKKKWEDQVRKLMDRVDQLEKKNG